MKCLIDNLSTGRRDMVHKDATFTMVILLIKTVWFQFLIWSVVKVLM